MKSGSTFTDTNIAADTSDTPPIQRNPFAAAGDWPGCSTWHDGRQWFARTDKGPQTLWASQSANFKNMSVSEPTRDSDAITRTIASREVNEIRFLLSLNSLLVFTSGGEWKCWAGSQSDVITPANTSLKPQGYTGISHVSPSVCAIQEQNETALYFSVRRVVGGRTVRYVERMVSRLRASMSTRAT